ncbi:N-acetyltransferase [Aquibacillus halophilus]|uniref:N-acetyltransferase n=1 Tax=Aquibacillus halophilus TaxID=930132 RepID=A0A6A8D8H0_9BACI|nr:N-acetyltransferase [Aquibacillus halophilus]MRH42053.1 N-acetyltransferase [Aquibacillus halophilus]
MNQGLLQMRKLTEDDITLVREMQTNIDDDYVIRIFPKLVQSDSNAVYGLFSQNNLLAIGGYTVFPGGYAMLGRLRSDHRYLSKGHGTEILSYIKRELEKDPSIKWIGANTNVANIGARRVIEKLGLMPITKLHSLPVINKCLISGTEGEVWNRVEELERKRTLINSIQENTLGIYPYECYYPFPLTPDLLTDEHLNQSAFFENHSKNRFMVIKNDQKHDWFAQVKYFWDDHFDQPGFWETIFTYTEQQPEEIKAWVDFSQQGYEKIPTTEAFEVTDAWILYGNWIN